jgi:hypothetical protein
MKNGSRVTIVRHPPASSHVENVNVELVLSHIKIIAFVIVLRENVQKMKNISRARTAKIVALIIHATRAIRMDAMRVVFAHSHLFAIR